jgi:hypothetical protein
MDQDHNPENTHMETKIDGDKLIIVLDISASTIQSARPSASGKTRLVASSHGAVPIETPHGKLSLSLNLTTK